MKFLEHRIPPPIVVLVISGAVWLISRGIEHVTWPGVLRIGVVTSLLGFSVALSGFGLGAFARAKTTIDPVNLESASSLVISGVFRLSRNPMYVGFATLVTAWSAWREERVLSAKFCFSYNQYRDRVRR